MASNGPPDDFNNQPTQFADYGVSARPSAGGPPPTVSPPSETPPEDESPPLVDPLDEAAPTPWYRRPAALAGWIASVLILLGLIAFGVMELMHSGQGTSHTPSTSTTPSTTTTPTQPTSTTTTEPSNAPPSGSAVEPPAQQPTQQPTRQPNQQQPTHRHHLPPLPSVITIPEVPTVITLPPGLS
ncbi:MAG: hypothetical protein ACLQIK_10665 [Mycobacterium sp.]|uniref:hypothetical protein n=1 Tax=Mycobacterium sp. TaxID=1785 RepID=UPI003F9E3D36